MRRLLLLPAAWALMCAGALAQTPRTAPDFSKLNRELEQRVPPATPESPPPPVTRGAPRSNEINNYNWIKPKAEQSAPAHQRRGFSGGGVRGVAPLTADSLPHRARPGTAPQAAAPQEAPQPPKPQVVAEDAIVQQEKPEPKLPVPLTLRNSYVILLKPELVERPDQGASQILKLLKKYGLTFSRRAKRSASGPVSASGRVVVEFTDEDAATARGLKAPDADMDKPAAPGNLKEQLAPEIINKLRREPIVDDAYVNSTVKANTLPRAVQTAVQYRGNLYRWSWTDPSNPTPDFQDGNWGLKDIRVPAVWTIMARFRETTTAAMRPKIAVVDQGFSKHRNVAFSLIESSPLTASAEPDCNRGHGTHVAGIIAAATLGNTGIDGIIPKSTDGNLDAVPFHSELFFDSLGVAEQDWYPRFAQFADVLQDIEDYISIANSSSNALRVMNLSLGYNLGGILTKEPEATEGLPRHALALAKDAQRIARRSKEILFVVAAGNDSMGRATPLNTKWGSPFAWAATQDFATSARSDNVLVVEAIGRNDKRADFSNIGGHIAAPGVDILSTLGPGENHFGVCSGTSQAAPHVAAVATLLFELAPTKKPQDIAAILRQTAALPPERSQGAPRLDAFEAVLKVYPQGLQMLADLNKDGAVDEVDLAIFKSQLDEITANKTAGSVFTRDLNGDDVVDASECLWPGADLNGSGSASMMAADEQSVMGSKRSDLEVMELAWTKGKDDFRRALKESGLRTDARAPATAATSPAACQ
jgi:subtilisin family serine protease